MAAYPPTKVKFKRQNILLASMFIQSGSAVHEIEKFFYQRHANEMAKSTEND